MQNTHFGNMILLWLLLLHDVLLQHSNKGAGCLREEQEKTRSSKRKTEGRSVDGLIKAETGMTDYSENGTRVDQTTSR